MGDKVQLTGILEKGYGISPKLVMRDEDLSIEAKAIYAYMASYAGNGSNAFPSISLACKDLNVSEKRFRRHRDQLIDKGYITIQRNKNNKGKYENNIYIINHTIEVPIQSKRPYGQNAMMAKRPYGQNDRTNNNSSFNNNSSLISSSGMVDEKFAEVFSFYTENLQVGVSGSPYNNGLIVEFYDEWGRDLLLAAMKLAAQKEKKGVDYLQGILKKWREAGVKSVEDARKHEVEFRNRMKKPYKNNVVSFKNRKPEPEEYQYDYGF